MAATTTASKPLWISDQALAKPPEAVHLIELDPNAKILAGGTDLLVQVRAGVRQPTAFIDVKRIPELVSLSVDADGLHLGAATSAAEICEHAEVTRLWPGLAEAIALIGSTQIQGRASVGGNLCNASPAADTTCALIVNRARCVIAGPKGERTVAVEDFCTAPGRTVLDRGELLVGLLVPRPAPRTADAYLLLMPTTEMDIAVAGAG
jgi:carbon-monoxide dehydrogenase medium subunit